MKYIVKRAFLLAGVRQEVGSEIDIADRGLIGTLKSADKIEAVESVAETRGPMTTENSGLVAGPKSAPRSAAKESP